MQLLTFQTRNVSDGTIIGKRQVAIVYHATSNRPKIEILKLTHKLTTRSAQQRSTLHVLRTDKREAKKSYVMTLMHSSRVLVKLEPQ